MNYIKSITLFFLFITFYACYSQSSIYKLPKESDLIFNGSSIDEAMAFEASIKSKLEKQYATTIVLSPKLYPYVNNYDLDNPKGFSRNIPQSIPGFVEYYYDRITKEIKYVSYKWTFFNKIEDDVLFDKKKLKRLVEEECGELESYTKLFSKLEKIIISKNPLSVKIIKVNKIKNKKIEWKSDTTMTSLSLEFQDCSDQKELLPGWFVVNLIEYSK